jgi:hypothetical protein
MNGLDRDQMIQETHDTVLTLKAVLLGVPDSDDKGLVGKVCDNSDNIEKIEESCSKLRTILFWLIGLLVGGGVITGSVFGISDLLKAAGGG